MEKRAREYSVMAWPEPDRIGQTVELRQGDVNRNAAARSVKHYYISGLLKRLFHLRYIRRHAPMGG